MLPCSAASCSFGPMMNGYGQHPFIDHSPLAPIGPQGNRSEGPASTGIGADPRPAGIHQSRHVSNLARARRAPQPRGATRAPEKNRAWVPTPWVRGRPANLRSLKGLAGESANRQVSSL